MASKKKVLLIAGHGEGDPGACSIWGKEADYTRELASMVKESLNGKLNVTMYDQKKNCYYQSKKGNVPDYAAYDFTLEIHFNAKVKKDPKGDGRYTGVGGYVHPANSGKKVARMIIDNVKNLGFKEWLIADSTGLLNLNNAQRQGAKYFLLETAFIDDGDDMRFYTANKEKVATKVAQGIISGLGLQSSATEVMQAEYYRVMECWKDAKSQIFAGTKEGAIRACRLGYSVFDPKGKCVYTNNINGMQGKSFTEKTEKEFIEEVGTLYTNDEKKSGILACVSLAQAILESGYGSTDLALKANNMHGMKTVLSGNVWEGTTWDGSSNYEKDSPEVVNGKTVMKKSKFRAYDCIEDSIADHSAYLLNASNGAKRRYEGIAGEKDYKKTVHIIQSGGYATDLEYASKLIRIIEKWGLEKYNVEGAVNSADNKFNTYMIKTTCDALRIRSKADINSAQVGIIREQPREKKTYTIVEESNGWGRLKSGAGWICLKYTKKIS